MLTPRQAAAARAAQAAARRAEPPSSPAELAQMAALIARQLGQHHGPPGRGLHRYAPEDSLRGRVEAKWWVEADESWPAPGAAVLVRYRGLTVLRARGEDVDLADVGEADGWQSVFRTLALLASGKARQRSAAS